jgi:hypothetical protein
VARTLQQLAQESLDAQNAPNGCALARSMHEAMCDLNKQCGGTTEVNRHPITKMWIYKLADLAGIDFQYDMAIDDTVKKLAAGESQAA